MPARSCLIGYRHTREPKSARLLQVLLAAIQTAMGVAMPLAPIVIRSARGEPHRTLALPLAEEELR